MTTVKELVDYLTKHYKNNEVIGFTISEKRDFPLCSEKDFESAVLDFNNLGNWIKQGKHQHVFIEKRIKKIESDRKQEINYLEAKLEAKKREI